MTIGGYPKRTEQNILDSDGTIIFTYGNLTGGSLLTKRLAIKHGKPWLHFDLDRDEISKLKGWIIERDIKVLNVAGKSGSKSPQIYNTVKNIIIGLLND